MLDKYTGLDPPGFKLRAATGFDATDFFVTGYDLLLDRQFEDTVLIRPQVLDMVQDSREFGVHWIRPYIRLHCEL